MGEGGGTVVGGIFAGHNSDAFNTKPAIGKRTLFIFYSGLIFSLGPIAAIRRLSSEPGLSSSMAQPEGRTLNRSRSTGTDGPWIGPLAHWPLSDAINAAAARAASLTLTDFSSAAIRCSLTRAALVLRRPSARAAALRTMALGSSSSSMNTGAASTAPRRATAVESAWTKLASPWLAASSTSILYSFDLAGL